jgi:hypothetical protein
MPPVADRRGPARGHLGLRHGAGRQGFGREGEQARFFLHRAPGVGGLHGEAVHVGAVEAGHVDGGDHVLGQHAAQRGVQRHGVGAQRRQRQVFAEAALGLVAREHVQELGLGFHGHA